MSLTYLNIFHSFFQCFYCRIQINLKVDLPTIQDIPGEYITMLSVFKINNTDTTTISFVMLFAIWYHLYNVKNMKSTHGEVLLLIKLQASAYSFTKVSFLLWVLFRFFKLYRWYQFAQKVSLDINLVHLLTLNKFSATTLIQCFYL